MLDYDAIIIPGESAGGLKLGAPVSDLVNNETIDTFEQLYDNERRLHFGAIDVWEKDGRITQIGVYRGYTGGLPNGIKIGTTVEQVERIYGKDVIENEEDDLIVEGESGWCFDTELLDSRDFKTKKITSIIVFHEES